MLSILHSALDLVMLMSYDYHEVNRTSINAPLNRESNQNPYTETVAENVERVLAQGCRPEKVIMGIPTYGRTYTLKDAHKNGVDEAVDGPGEPGPYTLSHGSLGFNEVSYLRKLCCANLCFSIFHIFRFSRSVSFSVVVSGLSGIM